MTTPLVTIERITPSKAKKWLARNVHTNRRLDLRKISTYAHLLKEKRWDVNGESVKFDQIGNLIDGQHRLTACAQSGVGFTSVVVRGIVPRAIATIDMGRKRTLADSLRFFGKDRPTERAPVLNWLWRFQQGPVGLNLGATPETLLALDVNDRWNTEITAAISAIPRLKHITRKWTGFCRALYVVTGEAPHELRESWATKLTTGAPMRDADPVAALRDYLHEWSRRAGDSTARKGGHWSTRRPALYVIKAWNDHCRGGRRKLFKVGQQEEWPTPLYLHPLYTKGWASPQKVLHQPAQTKA